jgi:hypothetical protein
MNMKLKQALIGVAALLVLAATHANGQVVIAGSSALYLEAGQASFVNQGCGWDTSTKEFNLSDSRIPATDAAALWITWQKGTGTCAAPVLPTPIGTSVIAYVNTDSTVGNRCFFASPRCTVTNGNSNGTANAGDGGSGTISSPGYTETALPANVLAAIVNATVSVAATDIRPEDAKFATLRALTGCGSPVATGSQYLGLGYSNGQKISGATTIISAGTGGSFNVGNFNLMGTDPLTSNALPGNFVVTPVAAVPVVVFVNPQNTSGFGNLQISNVDSAVLAGYLDGTYGRTDDMIAEGTSGAVAATVVLREPLSGTYNVMEYAIPNSVENQSSQEVGLAAAAGNAWPPFNCSAIGGVPQIPALYGTANAGTANPLAETDSRNGVTSFRARAIGTGSMVKAVEGTKDALGYAFWSAANFSAATPLNAKYLTVDGIDPIQETWSDGLVPISTNDLLGNVTFAHVKDGTYPIWSIIRFVSDPSGNGFTVARNLAVAVASFLSPFQPDFVPLSQLGTVRSHFAPPGISFPGNGGSPANGTGTIAEAGGDVAGMVYTKISDVNYDSDNGAQTGNTGHRQ